MFHARAERSREEACTEEIKTLKRELNDLRERTRIERDLKKLRKISDKAESVPSRTKRFKKKDRDNKWEISEGSHQKREKGKNCWKRDSSDPPIKALSLLLPQWKLWIVTMKQGKNLFSLQKKNGPLPP